MPINIIQSVAANGTDVIPHWDKIKVVVPILTGIGLIKAYFGGSYNTWKCNMHGRVVIFTGATSGLGLDLMRSLANQGAQIICLVRDIGHATELIDDIREETGNQLVYIEKCDLADFYSIRQFVTKWLDNSPPRRLDMVVCCAGVFTPPSIERQISADGIEEMLHVNYLAHYHLLTLLEPAIRAQPPDRNVRIVLISCVTHVMADLDLTDLQFSRRRYPIYSPWKVFGTSKLLLALFGFEFQRRILAYKRPDQAPCNVRILIADPGVMRTPSFKRFITCGSVFLLFVYTIFWPLWWFLLKSSHQGSQTLQYALNAKDMHINIDKALYLQECQIRTKFSRPEFFDNRLQKEIYDKTKTMIETIEKRSAFERAKKKAKYKAKKDDTSIDGSHIKNNLKSKSSV